MKLGDFLNAINHSKAPLLDDPEEWNAEQTYLPFIVNRTLSYFPDAVMCANMMNMFACLDHKLQFDYLRLEIPKYRRFTKWYKPEVDAAISDIKEYFGYSFAKAEAAMNVLTVEQIKDIRKRLATRNGGQR